MKASWGFFRYTILDQYDDVIQRSAHENVLELIRGRGAPYRVRDPQPRDFNNYLMELKAENIEREECLLFLVGQTVDSRAEHRYDKSTDELKLTMVNANDTRFTTAIMVPRLGVAAFRDGSGDRLSANSGIGRLRAIMETNSDYSLTYEKTASHEDVLRAMRNLAMEEFTFDVRPFNPHPSVPGDALHELLKNNRIGKLRGKAFPAPGSSMNSDPEGLISEAAGLSEKGYGQFGVKGRTPSGAEVQYKKPKMVGETIKDVAQHEKPTNLRVSVPVDDGQADEYEYVVRAMKELFDG